jgi:RNA-binding protein
MEELSGRKKRELKSLAHHLNPVVLIGHKGLSENVIKAFEKAIDDHELMKVKFTDFKEDKKELSLNLSRETGAALVDIIGNVAIFYREKEDDHLL